MFSGEFSNNKKTVISIVFSIIPLPLPTYLIFGNAFRNPFRILNEELSLNFGMANLNTSKFLASVQGKIVKQ